MDVATLRELANVSDRREGCSPTEDVAWGLVGELARELARRMENDIVRGLVRRMENE